MITLPALVQALETRGLDLASQLGATGANLRVEVSRIYAHRKAHKDRVHLMSQLPLDSFGKQPLQVASSGSGFPGGMAHAPCDELGSVQGNEGDRFICAALPFSREDGKRTFTQCIFRDKQPVSRCATESAKPTWLRHCDRGHPCREDYLCATVEAERPEHGACVPPYFLGQLRVDGHGFVFR